MKKKGGTTKDVLDIFDLPSDVGTRVIADAGLKKELHVYYFGRDGEVRDISNLDPGADSQIEAGWGGLTEFSGHVGQIVSRVANRFESQPVKREKKSLDAAPVVGKAEVSE
jgi:hypothetical protein